MVVYRSFPTSNHNLDNTYQFGEMLYIVRFLHQTTTRWRAAWWGNRCISFVSYIKPQHTRRMTDPLYVVYRSFPTSNHNREHVRSAATRLYIVRFLHQTTTLLDGSQLSIMLYIVRFLHQTTTATDNKSSYTGCISFVSYIKPQLRLLLLLLENSCISFVSYIKPQQR